MSHKPEPHRSSRLVGCLFPALFIGAVLCCLSAATAAQAQTAATWNVGLGTWSTPANWSCGSSFPSGCVPTTSTTASITNGGTAQITSGSAQSSNLTVSDGGVSVTGGGLTTAGTTLGVNGGTGVGSVAVTGSTSNWTDSTFVSVGSQGSGSLAVSNAGVVNTNVLTIGSQAGSNGTTTVTSGGQLNSVGATIGEQAGMGQVTITDPGSTWSSSNGLNVGFSGTGSLTVQNGGLTSVTGFLEVANGLNGFGTLTVESGGQVTATAGIGLSAGSVGSVSHVTVSGTGSTISGMSGFSIGFEGSASLTVEDGGLVESATLGLGNGVGASGALQVLSGGQVSSTGVITMAGGMNGDSTSTATALVSGAHSLWETGGDFSLGNRGSATVTITDGGSLNAAGGIGLANVAGSTGVLNVLGAGSQVASSYLVVGEVAAGTMLIADGGFVNTGATGGGIGNLAGSTGVVTVTGSGSQWLNTGLLAVGNLSQSQGSLIISNSGLVTDSQAAVGRFAGANGLVLVDDGTWTTTGSLDIGAGGAGVVELVDGATVNAGTTTVGSLGLLSIDPSTMNISGDFTLMSGGELTFGIDGPGTDPLDITGLGTFDGIIDLDFIDGFAPKAGSIFDLIHLLGGGDFSGAAFKIDGLEPGFEYSTSFSDGDFEVLADNDGVSETPEPGTIVLLPTGVALCLFLLKRSRIRVRSLSR